MPWMQWYEQLQKPAWTPAPGTISLIWTMLYPLILVSFGAVFALTLRKRMPAQVAVPFAMNLVANLLFMPLFAGLRNLPLTALDILIVWLTIIWMVAAVWKHRMWIAVAQVPYFVWVSIAMVLQFAITASNWGS